MNFLVMLAVPAVAAFLAGGLFARTLSQPGHVYASPTGQGCLVLLARLVQVVAAALLLLLAAMAV